MPVSHFVYGLRIESNLPLPGLAVCSDQGPIGLRILLNTRKEFAAKFSASLSQIAYISPHTDGNGESILQVGTPGDIGYIGFYYGDGARFAIEEHGREIWADWPENYSLEDACTYLVGPVIAFAIRLQGSTCLHASSVAIKGRAIVLMGRAGAGKSTTAAAFARLGYSVLSDDVVFLVDQGSQFQVQPGYPRVNLWPDSVRALFGSEEALPRITPTWGKSYLPLDQNGYRFQADPLPLGAIYVLAEQEQGLAAPVVHEVAPGEAFMTLVANTYVNYLLNSDMRSREFGVLGRVVATVPVSRLSRPADPSRVFDLCEAIVADADRNT